MHLKIIFAKRFKIARLVNGFSLQTLARALNSQFTLPDLQNYENGKAIPDAEKINILCYKLKVRQDFFFRNCKIYIGEIDNRELKKISKKEFVIIIENIKEYLSRYLELEEILVLSNTFSNPLKNHGNLTEYKQVNKAVHHLIKVWNLRSSVMINVVKVLEDHNIKVVKINSKSNFVVFHTFINESFPILVYNINKAKNLNILFLPELARLLLKFGDINEIQKERLCFHFASEFLSQVVTNNHQKAEEYNRFDQLLNKALFEDYITMSKAASLKNQSLVEFKKNIC